MGRSKAKETTSRKKPRAPSRVRHGQPRWTDTVCRESKRRAKYIPWDPLPSDEEWAEEMKEELARSQGEEDLNRFEIIEHHAEIRSLPLSEEEKTAKAIKVFTGQAGSCLGAGTLVTMLRNVGRWRAKLGRPFRGVAAKEYHILMKAAKKRYARLKGDGAEGITNEDANRLISLTARKSEEAAGVLYTMTQCGVRADTVTKLTTEKISLSEKELRVKVGVGKTSNQAGNITHPRAVLSESPIVMPAGFADILETTEKDALPFREWNASKLCNLLDEVCRDIERTTGRKPKVTTYSFRKLFVENRVVFHKGDMARVSKDLGHRNESVAPAFYLNLKCATSFMTEEEYSQVIRAQETAAGLRSTEEDEESLGYASQSDGEL